MPPLSSPVLSALLSPPLDDGRQLAGETEHVVKLEELHAAQAQAVQLRALHAAVFSHARSPLKAKNSLVVPDHGCISPSSTTGCTARSGRDYPVFMPAENRRNSIDNVEVSQELSRSSRMADDYTRSSSRIGSEMLSSLFGRDDSQLEEYPPGANLSSESSAVTAALGENSFKFDSLNSWLVRRATHSPVVTRNYRSVYVGPSSEEVQPHHNISVHAIEESLCENVKSRVQPARVNRPELKSPKVKPLSELLTEAGSQRRLNEVIQESHGRYTEEVAIAESGLSCDGCRPGSVSNKVTVVPLTDSRDLNDARVATERNVAVSTLKDRSAGNNVFRAWFARMKKKNPSLHTANGTVGKERASILNGEVESKAVDLIEIKLRQANRKKDAAVVEVLELRSAMQEMGKKLDNVEQYCRGLKHAVESGIRRENGEFEFSGSVGIAEESRDSLEEVIERPRSLLLGSCSVQPTQSEFFHAVTEARVGVKQFCRALVQQLQEERNVSGGGWEKLQAELLQSGGVGRQLHTIAGRVSRTVRYHMESVVNEAFYENFENVSFEKNGTHWILDPEERAQASYRAYVKTTKLGWEELLSKDSAGYSASFDGFCAEKLGAVVGRWWEGRKGLPEALVEAFWVAARWVWLLHHLALGFCEPAPAAIFRVRRGCAFDPRFMELLPSDPHLHCHDPMHVRLMVMPGFFVINDAVKCKVMCWPA